MTETSSDGGTVLKDLPSPAAGYAEPEERPPFLPYLAFMGVFGSLLATALAIAKRQGRELPERVRRGSWC